MSHRILNWFFVLTLISSLCLTGAAPAPPAATGPNEANLQPILLEMAAENPDATLGVIVQKSGSTPGLEATIAEIGGTITKQFGIINALAAQVPAHSLPLLAHTAGVRFISLDAPVYRSSDLPPRKLRVADRFNEETFANNDGTTSWVGDWTEIGENDGPLTNDVTIRYGGLLALKDDNRGLQRTVNLAGAEHADLTLTYKRYKFDDSDDYVSVQVSADGGVTWTEVGRVAGPGHDRDILKVQYDISDYISSQTVVRLVTSAGLSHKDTLYFDRVTIRFDNPAYLALPFPVPDNKPPTPGPSCDEVDCQIDASHLNNPYLDAVRASELWNEAPVYNQGQHVTVAVLDSGSVPSRDMKDLVDDTPRRIAWEQFSESQAYHPNDYYGHGAHLAGIIGGNGDNSEGAYVGVAPRAEIVTVKVTDDYGMGYVSDVVSGMEWVLNHKDEFNIRVANLSLNSSVYESYHTSPLSAALEILWFNGIVVVVSAGNAGADAIYPPANDPFVITVGATNDRGTSETADDILTSYSSYGVTEAGFTKPDLVAPGHNIVSLAAPDSYVVEDYPSHCVPALPGGIDCTYFRMSGTSMSAAVVSGAVALLLQDEPGLTPDQVKYRLMATARPLSGASHLDVYAAVHGTTTESANTGITASQLLWTGTDPVNWNSVNWNSVNWNSVNWNSVNWNSVNWNSVNWNSNGMINSASAQQAAATLEAPIIWEPEPFPDILADKLEEAEYSVFLPALAR